MNHPKSKIENKKLILSLDPSSTVVGYAVMTPQRELIQAGTIKPGKKTAASYEREIEMAEDLGSLLDQYEPMQMLIEWTKGKVGQRHQGLGAGLAVYGTGVGWIGCTCWRWIENGKGVRESFFKYGIPQLKFILENDWTRGVPKKARQIAIASLYPAYKIETDSGGDIADAIGLADWWLREQLLK